MNKYQSYQLIIYDRWGEEVFTTNKIGEGWDGEDTKTSSKRFKFHLL